VELLQGEDREEFRAGLLQRMEDILQSDFTPNPSPFICKSCDFRHICEYRRL
jgi:CRISPR/Cas system-associated exonuclease Cas4 (RecB family)